MVMSIKKYTKEECLSYLRDLKEKRPDYKYSSAKDKEFLTKISKKLDKSFTSIRRYMQMLDMFETDMSHIPGDKKPKKYYDDLNMRLDNYLIHIWSKKDDSCRSSLKELGEKFGINYTYVAERIKKLGLEEYKLSTSDLSANREKKKSEDRLEVYKNYYTEYKQTHKKVSYEDIAFDMNFSYSKVISEIKSLGFTDMICPIKPRMSTTERKEYYIYHKSEIGKSLSILEICVTVGLSPEAVYGELYRYGIKRSKYPSNYDFDSIDTNSDLYYSVAIYDNFTY